MRALLGTASQFYEVVDLKLTAVPLRARREQLKSVYGLSPESQGQNLALTVSCVPSSHASVDPYTGLRRQFVLDSDHLSVTLSVEDRLCLLLLFFTLVTGPRRSLSLKLSDTRVYGPVSCGIAG